MRYDGHRYVDCRWCSGRGCLACEASFKKDYADAFPDGPKPIATFTLDDLPAASAIIGIDALRKAFGNGGGGVKEIEENFKQFQQTK